MNEWLDNNYVRNSLQMLVTELTVKLCDMSDSLSSLWSLNAFCSDFNFDFFFENEYAKLVDTF